MIRKFLKSIFEWLCVMFVALFAIGIIVFGAIGILYIDKRTCLENGVINNIQTEYIIRHGCFVLDNNFKYRYDDYMKAKAYKNNGVLLNND